VAPVTLTGRFCPEGDGHRTGDETACRARHQQPLLFRPGHKGGVHVAVQDGFPGGVLGPVALNIESPGCLPAESSAQAPGLAGGATTATGSRCGAGWCSAPAKLPTISMLARVIPVAAPAIVMMVLLIREHLLPLHL
jgi:hypothetical protein